MGGVLLTQGWQGTNGGIVAVRREEPIRLMRGEGWVGVRVWYWSVFVV